MDKKKKLIIIGIIALVLVIVGTTYAILTWTSNKINIGLNSACFTIDYTKGQDISGNLKLLNESDLISNNKFTIKEGIGISAVNIGIKSTCTIEGFGSIYLNVTNISDAFATGDSKGSLKYAVLTNTSTVTTPSSVTVSSLLNQSFDIVSSGSITSSNTITLLAKQLSNTETYKYLVVIYVDKSLAGNSITSASFNGNISADAEQGKYVDVPPSYCFTISNKNETDKTASISAYNCYDGNSYGYEAITDVRIPSIIDGYTINSIGMYTFYSRKLTSIVIPDTIATIGDLAFSANPLKSIVVNSNNPVYDSRDNCNAIIKTDTNELLFGGVNTKIPDTVTIIGSYAFDSAGLTSITIPSSIVTIGNRAFGTNKLTNIIIPSSVTSIESGAFASNPLESIVVDSNNPVYDSRDNCNAIMETATNSLIQGGASTIIPDTTNIIKTYAFNYNEISEVSIPNSVTTIEANAFFHAQLKKVTIPSSVTDIKENAFIANPLESVVVDSNNPVYDSRDNCNAIIKTDTNELLFGGVNTKIPNTVTTICTFAFFSVGLTNITIPDSVTIIAHDAFSSNKLTSIIIPNSVTAIGDSSFLSNKLTSITIPSSVTYLGKNAFSNNNLDSVLIEEGSQISTLGAGAFLAFKNSASGSSSNLNLKKIYYNGTTSLPWINAISYNNSSTKFVTGTVPAYTRGNYIYNEVVVTTGQPS